MGFKSVGEGLLMEVYDKRDVIRKLGELDPVIIEIGCGERKQDPNSIGIDIVDGEAVDIVADASRGLSFLPDECVDEVHAYHVIEHFPDTVQTMQEIYRVLKSGGRFIGSVPHFSNPYYYSDPTHKTFFGLYTFSYFTKEQPFRRKVPSHYTQLDFKIRQIKFSFWSPFLLISVINQAFGLLINSSSIMKEMYEAIFCKFISAHEISFVLEK